MIGDARHPPSPSAGEGTLRSRGEGNSAMKPASRYCLTALTLLAAAWIAFHLR